MTYILHTAFSTDLFLAESGTQDMTRAGGRLIGVAALALLCTADRAANADRLTDKEGPWLVTPGPALDAPGTYTKVRLPDLVAKGERPYGAALSLRSRKAIVFYLDDMLGKAKNTKIILSELNKGTTLWQVSVPGPRFPFDFDADGTRLLCRLDDMGTGKKDTAEVWTFAADGSVSSRRWVPYDDESPRERDLIWGAFSGTGRMATLSSGGQLVVWDAAKIKRLYSVDASTAIPAVSPNGKYIAFLRDDRVGLLDVATGAVVGFVSLGVEVTFASLAFRSDGQSLLCAAKDRIILVEPATARVRSISIPGITGQGLSTLPSVGWADDRLLFVNNNLIDPDIPIPVWGYMGGVWVRPAGGYVWFLAAKKSAVGLVPLRLPHASAVKKMMAARGDQSSFLLKPGDSVQVDVRQVPAEHQPDARETLEGVLRATEYQPVASAPIVLDVVPGKERFEEWTYKLLFGAFGDQNGNDKDRQEKHRFRVQPVEVRLLKDGKEFWNRRTVVTPAPPSSMRVSQNESLEDKLAPFSVTDYRLLRRLELPKFLQEQLGRGVQRGSLGHSVVGPDGLDEAFLRLEEGAEKLEAMKKARAKQK
jgi:hypothetical protein